jgi:hypothetical protein
VTKFRPCIDLHQGKVKQIVGNSLTKNQADLKTNFISDQSAKDFAKLYANDNLTGGHLIMLGSGNESAALEAVKAFPNRLQVGGGISQSAFWFEGGLRNDDALQTLLIQACTIAMKHDMWYFGGQAAYREANPFESFFGLFYLILRLGLLSES